MEGGRGTVSEWWRHRSTTALAALGIRLRDCGGRRREYICSMSTALWLVRAFCCGVGDSKAVA